jgi:hypothetical protein
MMMKMGAPSNGSLAMAPGEAEAPDPDAVPPRLAVRLMEIAHRVAPEEIGELWIFPPLPEVEESAEFMVFTRYESDGRCRLYTARRRSAGDPVPGGARGSQSRNGEPGTRAREGSEEITAHGAVPADRLPRLLERFQRRVGADHDPIHVLLEGTAARWNALVGGAASGEAEQGAAPFADVDGGVPNP